MAKIVQFGGFRHVIFEKIKSRHLITTIDHGDVKVPLLSANSDSFYSFLPHFFGTDNVIVAHCQHGTKIKTVTKKSAERVYKADGLLYWYLPTDKKLQKIVASTTGDCPHLIIEISLKNFKIVGVVHSGWQGTLDNIAGQAINMLTNSKMKLSKKQINIGLWPGICQDCYEVGDEIREMFEKKYSHHILNYFRPINMGKSWKLSLAGIIRHQLKELGIKEKQIEQPDICPCCYEEDGQPLFFSNRRDDNDKEKRNGVLIKV